MRGNKFILRRDDDETLTILLDGEEVGSANHDEDGWKGMETVEDLVKAIGRVLDIPVEEEESDENEEAEG